MRNKLKSTEYGAAEHRPQWLCLDWNILAGCARLDGVLLIIKNFVRSRVMNLTSESVVKTSGSVVKTSRSFVETCSSGVETFRSAVKVGRRVV